MPPPTQTLPREFHNPWVLPPPERQTLKEFYDAMKTHLIPMENFKQMIDIDDEETNVLKEKLYKNYSIFFDFLTRTYGEIKIPKGTILFHSNQFFQTHLEEFEPCFGGMRIQDIRTYTNKTKDNTKLYMSETYPRVFCNFTPAGNLEVAANMNASEAMYVAQTDMHFFQIPVIGRQPFNFIKDDFKMTGTEFFKRYIQEKNTELKTYSGFILATTVDRTRQEDANATKFDIFVRGEGTTHVFPEIVILDGFDNFKKIGQLDFLNVVESPLEGRLDYYNFRDLRRGNTYDFVRYLSTIEPRGSIPKAPNHAYYRAYALSVLMTEINYLSTRLDKEGNPVGFNSKTAIGTYGSQALFAYTIQKIPSTPVILNAFEPSMYNSNI